MLFDVDAITTDGWPKALKAGFAQVPHATQIAVAYSGGMDSTLLLYLTHQLCKAQRIPLTALHINHHLSPHADAWQQQCQNTCDDLDIPLHIAHAQLDANDSSIERRARDYRYDIFAQWLQENGSDALILLGHHQNDQAETQLFRLLRGTGVRGLSGIPQTRTLGVGKLHRPLLSINRTELELLAAHLQLQWVEDESNEFRAFDRNYIRHQVIPVIEQRWPQVIERITQSSPLCAEADALTQILARQDYQHCQSRVYPEAIDMAMLLQLQPIQQRNLIRHWLTWRGASFPGGGTFERIWSEVIPADADALPKIDCGNATLRRYRQTLFVVGVCNDELPGMVEWDMSQPINFAGQTLTATVLTPTPDANQAGMRMPDSMESVTLRVRRGGERLQLKERAEHRSLKKLLQEQGIPPWERARIPLIYYNEQLVAVAGLWLDSRGGAKPGDEAIKITCHIRLNV